MSARIIRSDCVEEMAAMSAASVDAIVTDPPYLLSFMGREWDHAPSPAEGQAMHERWAREALRVLKPGGHLLAFGGTRTYHRLVCAIEDAGFEIRDTIAWLYGSGFPKSLDVSKAIDKAAGVEREVTGYRESMGYPDGAVAIERNRQGGPGSVGFDRGAGGPAITAPATPDAERWDGWGTALKPAHEPIVVARKPLTGTVAANVLTHGCGALNVDGCRIGTDAQHRAKCESVVGLDSNRNGVAYGKWKGERESSWTPAGRWPANVCLDEQAATLLDAQTGDCRSAGYYDKGARGPSNDSRGPGPASFGVDGLTSATYGDSGGASRFLYTAKASSAERNAGLDGFEENSGYTHNIDGRDAAKPSNAMGGGERARVERGEPGIAARANVHPTVKPIALMRWLVRLVTPPGGTVLDPFTGSGTTGIAAALEGFEFVGIEREPEYAAIAGARIAWWSEHPDGMTLVKRLEAEAERAAVISSGQTSMFDP